MRKERTAAEQELEAALVDLAAVSEELERAAATLETLNQQRRDSETALAAAESRTAELTRAAETAALARPVAADPPAPERAGQAALWSTAQIDAALARAPGLGDGPERAQLREMLIAGECQPQALLTSFGEINRQTLRALVGDLGACR